MGAKTLPEKEEKKLNNEDEHKPEKEATKRSKQKKERIRIFPIWLRIIVVLTLAVVALAVGLMFGYGVMGDGNATDVFKAETWQHIVDIVKQE